MSDPTQPPRDPDEPAQEPPPEQPPTSPFPESSLGSQETPAPEAPEPPAGPPAEFAPPEREWAAPSAPPPGSGMTSGDPLGGTSPAPSPPSLPPGYSSPAPPGAGGGPPAFSAPAPGTYQLGSWGARVGAACIDFLIIGVPAAIVMVILGVGAASSDGDGGAAAFAGAFLLSLVVFLIVGLLYAPVMMSRTNGQTVGRMATGIRVIRASGEPMTFGFAALREIAVKGLLFGVISSVTFGISSLLDVLWPLWDDENRALHDMVVNTRVVKA